MNAFETLLLLVPTVSTLVAIGCSCAWLAARHQDECSKKRRKWAGFQWLGRRKS